MIIICMNENIKWDFKQNRIIEKATNKDGALIIEGGPGTGKSLLSVEIAK